MLGYEPKDIIAAALAQEKQTLNEFEAKQLLSCFGVPVTREALADDVESAVAAAKKLGFPVVLKACGPRLVHKTEAGGVALNVKSAEEVMEEGARLLRIPGCESLLVQEMIKGARELVVGMVRDPRFGPCVMFGLGGVLTELMKDVVFRIAPLTVQDALAMMGEVKAKKILEPFRGESGADLEALAEILVALGKMGLQHERVQQIDINPLKICADGKPIAVDALVVLEDPRTDGEEKRQAFTAASGSRQRTAEDWRCLFEPRGVAVIGASSVRGKPGYEVIRNIVANGYEGDLYLVNPKGGEILGHPVTSSIISLPAGIDLGVLILPAEKCPQALQDCARRGIRHFVIAAGGFAEVDEQRGEIQEKLKQIARAENLHILGPNTSGNTSTPHNFTSTFFPMGKIKPGTVSYIAQTGNFATHTMKYILSAEHFGVARVVGLGNAIDIDESDALEYLGGDPETKAVILYLETIQRPRRFLEVAREVTRKKPVVMLKAGTTEAGKKAAIAHTASMALEDALVEGLLRQAGIVRISEYSHLIHVGKALSMVPLPKGNRVSFLAPSGAMLVVLADLCDSLGLAVPPLEPENTQRLQQISPPFIRMRNPVDIWASVSAKGIEFGYGEGMKIVLQDPNIDAVVPILMLTKDTGVPSFDFIRDLASQFPDKLILVTFSGEKRYMEECKAFLEPLGVPTFPEIEQPFEVLSILERCRKVMDRDP